MTRILSYEGSQDGLRFGKVMVCGVIRSFLHDRINNTVSLFQRTDSDAPPIRDETPYRVQAALQILRYEPGEGPLLDHWRGE